jgi:16S rRNA (adenine1518-N6/adenine1519-N6)-dimethyltransferase
VVEVGAGLGSLTVALADLGANVLAVELDRSLAPALEEVLGDRSDVRVLVADAMKIAWTEVLEGGPWIMASNLPYNVAVPVVAGMLERAPRVERFLVMVQREVGERLAAGPGEDAYGGISVRVAYYAEARIVRRVPPSVFWPEPRVESVVVELARRRLPLVATAPQRLFRVVDEGFAQRRKTMANALLRLGLSREGSLDLLRRSGIDERARAESLSLEELATLAEGVPWNG